MPLPEGWIETTLGELGTWSSGGTPSRNKPEYFMGNIPWVKTGDLNDQEIYDVEEKITEEAIKNSSAKVFPKGSVLIAMYGATIGKTGLLKIDASTNQACAALIYQNHTADVIPFVWKYLISKREEFKAIGQGGAQPNISQTIIKEFPISLPPLNEQRRIVAKLEGILAKVQSAQAHLDKIPGLLKQTRQAILSAAVSGKLTEDWREKQGVGLEDWQQMPFEQLVASFQNGLSKRSGSEGKSIVVLRLADIKNQRIESSEFREILLTDSELGKYKLQEDDILIIRVNGSHELVGRFILCRSEDESYTYCDHFIRLQVKKEIVHPPYLFYLSDTEDFRYYIEKNFVSTAGQKTISQGTLSQIQLILPSLEEQQEIVRRVEALFERLDRIEAATQTAKAKVDAITQSTLAKAFRGELVLQDPTDEPASILLERIKLERQAMAPAKSNKPQKSKSNLPEEVPSITQLELV